MPSIYPHQLDMIIDNTNKRKEERKFSYEERTLITENVEAFRLLFL